jgi:hypothetical protein
MYNLVVNLYYEKDSARFGLKRAKIAKIIIFHFSAIYTTKHVFYDVMGLIFRKCNSLNKQNAKNLVFYAIVSGVGIEFLTLRFTELHKILITCIHFNDNINSYPPNPSFYILIVVHKLQDLSNSEE